MFTKRNATLHHRSFTTMMKRNKPMTSWFLQKSKEEQGRLLLSSAKKAQSLRDSHKQKEKDVLEKTKVRLLAVREELNKKRQKAIERKAAISGKVKSQGGPCLHERDVDNLLVGLHTVTAKKAALNNEIQYQKVVIGAKSPLPKSSKLSWDVVAKNLKSFLQSLRKENTDEPDEVGNGAIDHEETMEIEQSNENPHQQHSPDISDDDDALDDAMEYGVEEFTDETDQSLAPESEIESDFESSSSEKSNQMEALSLPDFKFTGQGLWVAVVYESDTLKGSEFYIGQVVDVHSEDRGTVNFLQQCGVKDSLFKFPSSPDIETDVSSEFVFAWDFNVGSTNGRIWSIENMKELRRKFRLYLSLRDI